MMIEITEEEIEEIQELIEEYNFHYGDASYFYHLANYLIEIMIKNKVIDRKELP